MRIEKDALGEIAIDEKALWGSQTQRAIENFPISGYRWHPEFIRAFAVIKMSCAIVNNQLGYLSQNKAEAIKESCREILQGKYHDHIIVDSLQGGAGTSTNMNFNEVIANLAILKLNGKLGNYDIVHPLHDVNLHQSTNDVFPTALKIATLKLLKNLEKETALLQEAFQNKEQEFQDVVKLGRTQLQDAIPMTLGMEFGSYAEAFARDRWRIFKSRERIKVINIGGTAIGTGLGAPRKYIFKVTEVLRDLTGLNIARGENLVETTQNLDSFVEISGMLKSFATNLIKCANDLRLLASGPAGGLSEITLPPVQAGSTIMPGKVNPVIPEAVVQVGLKVISNDLLITQTSSMGQLELNHLLPLLAHSILESLEMLINISKIFREKTVIGIKSNPEKCLNFLNKSQSIATILLPKLGYKKIENLLYEANKKNIDFRTLILEKNILSEEELSEMLSPKKMYKLGF